MVSMPSHFVEALDSIEFPASKYEVVLKAEELAADRAFIRRILGMPSDIYTSRAHLNRELRHIGLLPEKTAASEDFMPAPGNKNAAGGGSSLH